MDNSQLIIAIMAVPVVAAVIMGVLPSRKTPKVVYEILHMIGMVVVCVLAATLIIQVDVLGMPVGGLDGWFSLDALGTVFVLLIALIGLFSSIHSLGYMRSCVARGDVDMPRFKRYYAFLSLFIFTMLLATLSNNIIMMWASIEATTLATVFLVGTFNKKLHLEAAWKYIIVCTVGVAFGLYGTVLVYANAVDIMANPEQAVFWNVLINVAPGFDATIMKLAFVFVAIGFGTKAGFFPMHTWMPDAYSKAPAPASGLLSGVLSKCAILIVIRFYVLAVQAIGPEFPQLVMTIFGVCSIVFSAFAVFTQRDLKRKFAYSSVENIGIVALCLGFGGPIGIAAALLHVIFHGLTKSLVFFLSGNVYLKFGTLDLDKISGIIRVAPITATLLCVGLFALVGFPPFPMFISEVMTFAAGLAANALWIVIVIGAALTVVIAAFTIVVFKSILGEPPAEQKIEKREVHPLMIIPEIILMVIIVWFGIAMPQPVLESVEKATCVVMQEDIDIYQDSILDMLSVDSEAEPTDGPDVGPDGSRPDLPPDASPEGPEGAGPGDMNEFQPADRVLD